VCDACHALLVCVTTMQAAAARTIIIRRVLVQESKALSWGQLRVRAAQGAACGRARQGDGAQERHV
jgi:hypothetical protein